VYSHHPFPADSPHRLRSEFSGFLFALAWHTELSVLLYDVIGDLMIPFAAMLQPQLRGKLPMLLNGPDNPQKCPFPLGDLHPHHPSLPKLHVDRFSYFCTAHHRVTHYFIMRPYVRYPKIALSPWWIGSLV